jgi:hypothetical protein
VVFITHRGTTHIAQALKAQKPLPAAHVNEKAMNTKTKPEKEPDLGNIKRTTKEAGALSRIRYIYCPYVATGQTKPPRISTELGIGRG